MREDVLVRRSEVLVRRSRLEPGEVSAWHTDACRRVTVVLSGERLTIEFRAGAEPVEVAVAPGLVGWDEPTSEVHRAVNSGSQPYEEVVTFLLDAPDQDPQPPADGPG